MRHLLSKITLVALANLLVATQVFSQKTFPDPAPSDPRTGSYALTHATIYLDYKTRLENATLVVREGKIVACGQTATAPADAVVLDCSGKTIYPAFIDCYAAGFGLPEPKAAGQAPREQPQMLSNQRGAYSWNEALKIGFNAAEAFVNPEKVAEEWRKLGFATLQTFRADGISRGTGAVVSLTNEREHLNLLAAQSAHFLSFRKGTSTQGYPSSLMGCIALLRQTYLDGQWYKTEGSRVEKNLSLEAWNAAQPLPQIFEVEEKWDIARAARIGQEFGQKFWVKTAGDEYQRLDALRASPEILGLIVGLNFPEPFDVRDPFAALDIQLKDLKHWEMAPSNPARLDAAGVAFALTTNGLKDKSKFWERLRKAIEYGLSEESALRALTERPANLLKIYDRVGSLEAGKLASFLICDGDIFDKKTALLETWAAGKQFVVKDLADVFPKNLLGEFDLKVGAAAAQKLVVKQDGDEASGQIVRVDSSKSKVKIGVKNGIVSLNWAVDTIGNQTFSLSGNFAGTTMSGRGTSPDGQWLDWSATQTKPAGPPVPTKKPPVKFPEVGEVTFPFTAFGWTTAPTAGNFLIKNVTVWTNERDAVLPNTDVLLSGGKITQIGKRLTGPAGTVEIEGTGKYLTAGIVDEHSHIAIARGVNEGTQESSAEVRIGDVVDPEDVDIYRQLAGGVTASHLLHGSANPIGGQTQLIRLKWGATAEGMKFPGWPGFIKFALGENVKQSNWGDNNRTRYPQTRMGVEQVYVDYFTRAQEYARLKKSGKAFRKDLDLECLLEILEAKRFVTCHSYVQSEITMLMRVAERFGFRINTFTHILEGYKVADKMAKHGVGGAGFADWWDYKWEVYSAIPMNNKLMADQGVVSAINSDDAEMARRLNQEAAKSVMYAGMKEADAWKMVTLNPAKLLRVDERVGSIRVGKDADVVLWNDNPLSVYARAEMTWVEGIRYFDRTEDARLQELVRRERARLIQKMLSEKKETKSEFGKPSVPKRHHECDDQLDEG